jgi:hypothetical protein
LSQQEGAANFSQSIQNQKKMEGKNWRLEGLYKIRIMSDNGVVAVCDIDHPEFESNGVLIANAPQTARELASAEARIERLENALMDALDQNGYSMSPIDKTPIGRTPQWVDSARVAIDWRGSGALKGLQEMSEATPDGLMAIIGNALHSDYMRPCDERP